MSVSCKRCERTIELVGDTWVAPKATGDDSIWRETCDANHEDIAAAHEPGSDQQLDVWLRIIPALRIMSAERLAVGDIYYGSVQDLADQRKGWAVIEQEGQEVADVTNYASTNRVDVIVNTPEGILTLAMLNDTQVLIEHKGHPAAVHCACDDSDVYDGYAECSVHPRPTDQ